MREPASSSESALPSASVRVRSADELGPALAHLRASAGLTQDALGEWLGVDQTYVSALEQPTATKRLRRTFELLDVLGLELVIRRRGS